VIHCAFKVAESAASFQQAGQIMVQALRTRSLQKGEKEANPLVQLFWGGWYRSCPADRLSNMSLKSLRDDFQLLQISGLGEVIPSLQKRRSELRRGTYYLPYAKVSSIVLPSDTVGAPAGVCGRLQQDCVTQNGMHSVKAAPVF
jgi:hypothetical protein